MVWEGSKDPQTGEVSWALFQALSLPSSEPVLTSCSLRLESSTSLPMASKDMDSSRGAGDALVLAEGGVFCVGDSEGVVSLFGRCEQESSFQLLGSFRSRALMESLELVSTHSLPKPCAGIENVLLVVVGTVEGVLTLYQPQTGSDLNSVHFQPINKLIGHTDWGSLHPSSFVSVCVLSTPVCVCA